jgi:hypothetical protein
VEFGKQLPVSSALHHLSLAAPLPGDEINVLANKIKAEAEFFAERSELAKTTVDLFRNLDNQLKLTTGNTIDLKNTAGGRACRLHILGDRCRSRNANVGDPGAVLTEPFRRVAQRAACHGYRSR